MTPFVLASRSPRRRSLLASVGLNPEVQASDVDETPEPAEDPVAYGQRVASAKAAASPSPLLVLAADTVVAKDGVIFGKAVDEADARRMLRALSGQLHHVHTAVALRPDLHASIESIVVSTEVRFRALTDGEISRYVASGEPMDKAGAYGIQGLGGALVASVRGSYTNVVGLPLEETLALLSRRGIMPC